MVIANLVFTFQGLNIRMYCTSIFACELLLFKKLVEWVFSSTSQSNCRSSDIELLNTFTGGIRKRDRQKLHYLDCYSRLSPVNVPNIDLGFDLSLTQFFLI